MEKAYKFRFYPTKTQIKILNSVRTLVTLALVGCQSWEVQKYKINYKVILKKS